MGSSSRRRRPYAAAAGALVCTLLSATGIGPLLTARASAATSVQFSGYGFGHGRGMGQWGAFGYASEYGWSYRQILSHYYGGTMLGAVSGPEPDITVHLVELDGRNTIATGVAGGALVATWAGALPITAAAFEVTSSAGLQEVLTGPSCAGPWRPVAQATSSVSIVSTQPGTGAGEPLAASQLQACIPGIGARTYQGPWWLSPAGRLTTCCLWSSTWMEWCPPSHPPHGPPREARRSWRRRPWLLAAMPWPRWLRPAPSATRPPARCTRACPINTA